MSRYFALLVVISLSFACCKAGSDCEQQHPQSYLDAAVEMTEKAKHQFSKCCKSDCDKNLADTLLDAAIGRIAKVKRNLPECVRCLHTRGASDCSEILQMGCKKSGVYKIWPSRMTDDKPLEVYCDMQTDGGGWTTIQRRGNFQTAEDYFYRDWKSYKEGFGDMEKDFWLGNDFIFALTIQKVYSVRFDLRDTENNTRYAQYDSFRIDDENHEYTLHIAGYTGDAGDSMISSHDKQKFSTKDQDNDSDESTHCAEDSTGGWWYSACYSSNLNGLHLKSKNDERGVVWRSWKELESLESTEIKIRPKMFKFSDQE